MIKNFQDWRKVRMIVSRNGIGICCIRKSRPVYRKNNYLWDVAAGAAIVNAAGGRAIISNKNDKFQVDVSFSNSNLKL